jgi:hypothetical protein
VAHAAKSTTQALILALGLTLTACGPLINIPSPTTGANIAPSADTQPALCGSIDPIYLDKATQAALPRTVREDIAIQNRLIECVCQEDQRKTRECKIFLMGSK